MCINCGLPDYQRCSCAPLASYCDNCDESAFCAEKMDAECVIYGLSNRKPSKLINLNLPNNTPVANILEAIDRIIGKKFNIEFTPVATSSITWTAGGTAGHAPKADVKISPDEKNQLEQRGNGLFSKPYNENYLVKVEELGGPDYLSEKIVGDTDGCVSITTKVVDDQVRIIPHIDVLCLLKKIKEEFPTEFCQIFADVCQKLDWIPDELACVMDEIDFDTITSGSNLPQPIYSFIDAGTVYFVSQNNNTGKVWSINPYTYGSSPSITYLNETRSGTPYGASGGTYVSGQPYKGNAENPQTYPAGIMGVYYDVATRTLFLHGNKTYGCDWYSFPSSIWGKVTDNTGSGYNQTHTSDSIYIFVSLSSNKNTNLLLAGWGTTTADAGTRVCVIDKVTRQVTAYKNFYTTTIPGTSSNPFNRNWQSAISPANKIIVGKGQSSYRNVAIFDAALTTLEQELVLPDAQAGYSGQSGVYWQTFFYDEQKDKIYVNDYLRKVVFVYQKVGASYSLQKTFYLNNGRSYRAAEVVFAINPVSSEMFWDINYGDTSANYNPGTTDAPVSERISYKVNRDTLEIEKIYIGQLKAANLVLLPNGDVLTTAAGNLTPSASNPPATGTFSLSQQSDDGINTGMIHVSTLQEVNANNNNTPTGNVKPNVIGDPDYVADYQDLIACPVEYTLDCPTAVILTADVNSKATVEFGLPVQVTNNPVLTKIRASFTVNGTPAGTTDWNNPNLPNRNAFFATVNLSQPVGAGGVVVVSLAYYNSSNSIIASCANAASFTLTSTAVADAIRVSSNTTDICSQVEQAIYYNGPINAGTILYTNSSMTTPLTAQPYGALSSSKNVYQINTSTGAIVINTGLTC